MVAKAEYLKKVDSTLSHFTALDAQAWPANNSTNSSYCAHGETENRIKEQLNLFGDGSSTETLRANQLSLYFSSLAYLLVHLPRRIVVFSSTESTPACAGPLLARNSVWYFC